MQFLLLKVVHSVLPTYIATHPCKAWTGNIKHDFLIVSGPSEDVFSLCYYFSIFYITLL